MAQFWDTYTPDCSDCKSYERELADVKVKLTTARRDAFEEAAKIAERYHSFPGLIAAIAEAIRREAGKV